MAEKGENVKIVLKKARLAFAYVDKPKKGKAREDGTIPEPKYQVVGLMDPATEEGLANAKALKRAVKQALANKFGDNIPKLKSDRLLVQDGDEVDYDGFAGQLYFNASNTKRPVCFGLKKSEGRMEPEDIADYFYSGAYADLHVSIWVLDRKDNRRVCAQLDGLQFRGHGKKFGGGREISEEEFEDYDEEESDDDHDEAPRKKKRPVDDDEDDTSVKKKKRSVDDDDEDDVPAKKKKRPAGDDDVDEDDLLGAKKKKKRAIDEDDEEDFD